MNDWTFFLTDKGVQNNLAIEQLDLLIQQLLADTYLFNDRRRGSYVKFKIFPLEGPRNSTYSPLNIQEVADFFQVSKKTISRVDGKPLIHQNSSFYIKRVERYINIKST